MCLKSGEHFCRRCIPNGVRQKRRAFFLGLPAVARCVFVSARAVFCRRHRGERRVVTRTCAGLFFATEWNGSSRAPRCPTVPVPRRPDAPTLDLCVHKCQFCFHFHDTPDECCTHTPDGHTMKTSHVHTDTPSAWLGSLSLSLCVFSEYSKRMNLNVWTTRNGRISVRRFYLF